MEGEDQCKRINRRGGMARRRANMSDHYSSRKRGVEEANCIIKQRFRKYTDSTPVLCGTL